MKIPTVRIYGLNVSKMNMRDTVAYLTDAVEQRRSSRVITANPIMIMTALSDPRYHEVMRTAELLVPDGAGLVWAAGYVGDPVAERVTGFDLMHELLRIGSTQGWRVFLLGTSPEVIAEAAARLQRDYPGCTFDYRDGYFQEPQDEAVVARIRTFEPDLLFVGRGVETQEPWLARYANKLRVPVMMGVGGSFDVIAGKLKRAPVWMQRLRLEWFHRLLMQPSRFGRMLALPKFVVKVMREKEKVQKV